MAKKITIGPSTQLKIFRIRPHVWFGNFFLFVRNCSADRKKNSVRPQKCGSNKIRSVRNIADGYGNHFTMN